MVHQELGTKLLNKICNDIKQIAIIESYPKFEGKQLIMLIAPQRNKKIKREEYVENKNT